MNHYLSPCQTICTRSSWAVFPSKVATKTLLWFSSNFNIFLVYYCLVPLFIALLSWKDSVILGDLFFYLLTLLNSNKSIFSYLICDTLYFIKNILLSASFGLRFEILRVGNICKFTRWSLWSLDLNLIYFRLKEIL